MRPRGTNAAGERGAPHDPSVSSAASIKARTGGSFSRLRVKGRGSADGAGDRQTAGRARGAAQESAPDRAGGPDANVCKSKSRMPEARRARRTRR